MTSYIKELFNFRQKEINNLRNVIESKNTTISMLQNELISAKLLIQTRDNDISKLNQRINYLENKYIFRPEPEVKPYTNPFERMIAKFRN